MIDYASTAGPGSSTLFGADQITDLSIRPVQTKSIVVGAGPQGEGSDGPRRSLGIVLDSWTLLNGVAELQLLKPKLQPIEFRFYSVGSRWGCAAADQQQEADPCCSKAVIQHSGEQMPKSLRRMMSVPVAHSSRRWPLGPPARYGGDEPW